MPLQLPQQSFANAPEQVESRLLKVLCGFTSIVKPNDT